MFVLLNEAFLKKRRIVVRSWDKVVGSGWSEAQAGGVTESIMKRLISKTGLHLRMAR